MDVSCNPSSSAPPRIVPTEPVAIVPGAAGAGGRAAFHASSPPPPPPQLAPTPTFTPGPAAPNPGGEGGKKHPTHPPKIRPGGEGGARGPPSQTSSKLGEAGRGERGGLPVPAQPCASGGQYRQPPGAPVRGVQCGAGRGGKTSDGKGGVGGLGDWGGGGRGGLFTSLRTSASINDLARQREPRAAGTPAATGAGAGGGEGGGSGTGSGQDAEPGDVPEMRRAAEPGCGSRRGVPGAAGLRESGAPRDHVAFTWG